MKKASSIFFLVMAICVGTYLYQGCKPVWQFDHLENNARKVITGPELQKWATNLLAQYPKETSFKPQELGTNFPKQLLGLAPRLGPHIFVHGHEGTNFPPYVQLYWGSGFLGGTGFYLGATNLTSIGTDHVWGPGVYFYRF
jgi:hypothetical protein